MISIADLSLPSEDAAHFRVVKTTVDSGDGKSKTKVVVRCDISGHEIPAGGDKKEVKRLVSRYVQGKAYGKAKRKQRLQKKPVNLEELHPWVVEHRHKDGKLYCMLTKRVLNWDAEEVERHMAGRKFRSALKSTRGIMMQRFKDAGKKLNERELEEMEREVNSGEADDVAPEEDLIIDDDDDDDDEGEKEGKKKKKKATTTKEDKKKTTKSTKSKGDGGDDGDDDGGFDVVPMQESHDQQTTKEPKKQKNKKQKKQKKKKSKSKADKKHDAMLEAALRQSSSNSQFSERELMDDLGIDVKKDNNTKKRKQNSSGSNNAKRRRR